MREYSETNEDLDADHPDSPDVASEVPISPADVPAQRAVPGDGARDDQDLATAKAEFTGAEFRTDVGSAFYYSDDEGMRRAAAQDVPPFPGEYVLDLHGNESSVVLQSTDAQYTAELGAHDFGDVVRSTDWAGEDIRLMSCETGRDPEGFAQQLADDLRVNVTAPTTIVTTSEGYDGQPLPPIVSDVNTVWSEAAQDWFDVPELPETGRWVTFRPRSGS